MIYLRRSRPLAQLHLPEFPCQYLEVYLWARSRSARSGCRPLTISARCHPLPEYQHGRPGVILWSLLMYAVLLVVSSLIFLTRGRRLLRCAAPEYPSWAARRFSAPFEQAGFLYVSGHPEMCTASPCHPGTLSWSPSSRLAYIVVWRRPAENVWPRPFFVRAQPVSPSSSVVMILVSCRYSVALCVAYYSSRCYSLNIPILYDMSRDLYPVVGSLQ